MISNTKTISSIRLIEEIFNADQEQFESYRDRAINITEKHFGKLRGLFNPIYVSNICLADCPYCGYKVSNKRVKRRTLSANETVSEAKYLKGRGIKNILILAGDYRHDKYLEMLIANLKAIKDEVQPNWLGIEVATLEIEEYQELYKAGAKSVTVFQETYNRQRYDILHEAPLYKGDFDFRYNSLERAVKAGFEEVGFGVLYGIGFWKEDTINMIEHAQELKEKYPNIQLRFSFPRLQDSKGQAGNCKTENISRIELERCIVAVRLLFPSANLVLTGRENLSFLNYQLSIINIMGYAGSTIVGGYTLEENGLAQFSLNDNKKANIQDLINLIHENNYELHY